MCLNCSSLNEFGNRRNSFDLGKIKANSDPKAHSIIDTSKVYLEILTMNTFDNSNDSIRNADLKANPTYLKFYKNGRVGEFRNADINNVADFNPKKARSYLYKFKNNKFIVQVYFKNWQCGECFIKETLNKISNDTIEIVSGDYISKYLKIDLPKSYLKYKPDW
jgi:hypothetical protein